jgi:hypothetical protein
LAAGTAGTVFCFQRTGRLRLLSAAGLSQTQTLHHYSGFYATDSATKTKTALYAPTAKALCFTALSAKKRNADHCHEKYRSRNGIMNL